MSRESEQIAVYCLQPIERCFSAKRGAGGFNGIGKFRPQRDKGLYMKLQQIRETGAKMVISPCHNCWDAIRDMMEVYHVHDIKWSFLKPIIIDMMIVPDHLKPQDDE